MNSPITSFKLLAPVLLVVHLFFTNLKAQNVYKQKDASNILQDIKKLKVLGNVLYMAAHPDDENTRLISYLANEKLYNTSYLSLTRGDGGQNLIGPEQGEYLGVIRTQELLKARMIDGGHQYFSRARDFGFSKTPEETFKIWDKEKVLSDAVWVIRKLKPDIIVTRFSPVAGKTHGHHTASAILALEASDAAADSTKFPEQLKYVNTWSPVRVVWNTGRFFYDTEEKLKAAKPLTIDVGGYNSVIGKSYGEIASESRTMHKSQGFGTTASRGEALEYFEHLKGSKASQELLENINTGWSRINGSKEIEKSIDKVIQQYNPQDPSLSVNALINLYVKLDQLKDLYWKQIKQEEVKNIITSCLGIYSETTFSEYRVIPGEKVSFSFSFINRSKIPVQLKSLKITPSGLDTTINFNSINKNIVVASSYTIPESLELTQPFWLKEKGTAGMFTITDPLKVADAEGSPVFNAHYSINVNNITLEYSLPILNKVTDPVTGDIYKNIEVVPPVSVNVQNNLNVFPDNSLKVIPFTVKANTNNVKGISKILPPAGWVVTKDTFFFDLQHKGQEMKFELSLKPGPQSVNGSIAIESNVGYKKYNSGFVAIQYPHIGIQLLQPPTEAKLVKEDIKIIGNNIGYLAGAGDNVPQSLEQMGYNVSIIKDNDITEEKLKFFDAIVIGVRAFNTLEKIKIYQKELLQYVENGGSVIAQYNTANGLKTDKISPFELHLSSERITVEDAPVKILNPLHPLFNVPNKITARDFDGWVQERGLYFPDKWGKEFEPLLSCSDPGEGPKEGGLLVAKYGKGYFIYTSYSWFRQLPAGVPGAYRLFANMISIGKNDKQIAKP